MPADDPAASKFMYVVDGKKGWKHWWENGVVYDLENKGWRQRLPEYTPVTDQGEVILTVNDSLNIAYINSPTYQGQLETLYLSAIDVSTERFRLDTQFFGVNSTTYNHLGEARAAGGIADNSLRNDIDLDMRRRFATAGELVVGPGQQHHLGFHRTGRQRPFVLDQLLAGPTVVAERGSRHCLGTVDDCGTSAIGEPPGVDALSPRFLHQHRDWQSGNGWVESSRWFPGRHGSYRFHGPGCRRLRWRWRRYGIWRRWRLWWRHSRRNGFCRRWCRCRWRLHRSNATGSTDSQHWKKVWLPRNALWNYSNRTWMPASSTWCRSTSSGRVSKPKKLSCFSNATVSRIRWKTS